MPLLSDFKPSGKLRMKDLHAVGGIPAAMKMLLSDGVLHGDCITVTGKTVEDNLGELPGLKPGQGIVHAFSKSIKATGDFMAICKTSMMARACRISRAL